MKKIRQSLLKVYRELVFLYAWLTRVVLKKSFFHVPLHIRLWMNLNGFLADQYVLFDLKHNEMMDYLSELDWYKSRFVNDKYRLLLNDKLVCGDLLRERIPVPAVYAVNNGSGYTDPQGNRLTMDAVLHVIQQRGTVFIKPIGAGKGYNVFCAEYRDEKWYINGNHASASELADRLSRMKDWYISERIRQASFLDAIYSQTTNTMRIVTIRDPETNQCRICGAVQRFGIRECIPVDNASRGGLTARIDMDTGALSSAKSLHVAGEFSCHPNSGARIEGQVIPGWADIRDKVLHLSSEFPYLKLIAWDLLLTDDGFCMIEANASSGVNILQLWEGQRNKELGHFLRYHKIVRR